MKYFIYNCVPLIIIVIIFAYINSLNITESFTPKIREFYRPYMRNTRVLYSSYYDNTVSNMSNLFRKFGIM